MRSTYMKKITITQLAEMAEVSTTTIRRYLKNENVREDVAEKIKTAIEKTGFVMEEAKAKLNKPKTEKTPDSKQGYTFAILTKDATNPRSRKTIKGLQHVCYKNNALFAVFIAEGNAALEERYVSFMIQQKVDAVIIESCANPDGIHRQLKEANIPCVFLNNEGKDIHSLAVDEKQAGETLGNYLIEKHHLIIRYLGADEALSTAHYEGIRNAYHTKKQPLDFAMKMSDGTYLDIYDKIKEVFEEKIDLLILERDEMAIPLNKYLKEYHIAVPQNASVISFGGHAITRVMSPTLTSLAFDYNLYADFVYQTVQAIMENKKKPTLPEIYHIQDGDSVR